MGIIGCGSRGGSNTGSFLREKDVRVVAVCDVDRRYRDGLKAKVDKKYGNKDCKVYDDYRKLLEHPRLGARLG